MYFRFLRPLHNDLYLVFICPGAVQSLQATDPSDGAMLFEYEAHIFARSRIGHAVGRERVSIADYGGRHARCGGEKGSGWRIRRARRQPPLVRSNPYSCVSISSTWIKQLPNNL